MGFGRVAFDGVCRVPARSVQRPGRGVRLLPAWERPYGWTICVRRVPGRPVFSCERNRFILRGVSRGALPASVPAVKPLWDCLCKWVDA